MFYRKLYQINKNYRKPSWPIQDNEIWFTKGLLLKLTTLCPFKWAAASFPTLFGFFFLLKSLLHHSSSNYLFGLGSQLNFFISSITCDIFFLFPSLLPGKDSFLFSCWSIWYLASSHVVLLRLLSHFEF